MRGAGWKQSPDFCSQRRFRPAGPALLFEGLQSYLLTPPNYRVENPLRLGGAFW
jgi:hypothetical protein